MPFPHVAPSIHLAEGNISWTCQAISGCQECRVWPRENFFRPVGTPASLSPLSLPVSHDMLAQKKMHDLCKSQCGRFPVLSRILKQARLWRRLLLPWNLGRRGKRNGRWKRSGDGDCTDPNWVDLVINSDVRLLFTDVFCVATRASQRYCHLGPQLITRMDARGLVWRFGVVVFRFFLNQ